jgi:hypothetical protein
MDELNRYILIRYDVCRNQIVEGYFGTAEEAKEFARKTFPNDAISIYELAEDCVDLADE